MVDNRHVLVDLLRVCCSEEEVKKIRNGDVDNIFVYGSTSPMTIPLETDAHLTWA